MFTLIEIFDAKQYENILSPVCLGNLSKVIYVGTKETMTNKKISDLKAFFSARKYSIPIEFLYVERDNSESVTNRFSQIIRNNKNCIFDVTGGEDIILAIAGIICERYSVPIIRMDTKSGNYVSVYGFSDNLSVIKPSLSPRDFITLQGGRLIRYDIVSNFLPSDIDDINKMFSINSVDCEAYSLFCSFAAEFVNNNKQELIFSKPDFEKRNIQTHGKINDVLTRLCKKGVLVKKSELVYKFKSKNIMHCIMKAGNVLELYTALALENIKDKCSHIKTGAVIEWNDTSNYFETQNEIDVLAVSNGFPAFVSCKNGEVRKEALYELDAVSRALGGSYSKKVLVCTHISKNLSAREHFIKRARDMGIGLVYDVHKKSYEEFLHYLSNSLS